ncbi:hypothetical protein [Aeromonas caviae]|uniref:hypothetical protein n=1 Tax=Aeromonas caviae TaxID=648 RepID=UPI001FC8D9ED|nr:hypothetical protein [Aeromonas caviae]
MVKPALQAAAFVERLPRRPYCTDDPAHGLHIRPQATALAYRHVQHNPPPHVSCIVFDVDRKPYEPDHRCSRGDGGDVRQRQRLAVLVLPSITALIGGAGLFGVIHVVFLFL